jgi:hypothetical protein
MQNTEHVRREIKMWNGQQQQTNQKFKTIYLHGRLKKLRNLGVTL